MTLPATLTTPRETQVDPPWQNPLPNLGLNHTKLFFSAAKPIITSKRWFSIQSEKKTC